MSPSESAVAATNEVYDDMMFRPVFREFYEDSDFANFGYWREETPGPRQACEDLVARLLDGMPNQSGPILDVACGKGASTRCLLDRYPAEQITAINISELQLEAGRKNAPGARFLCMDATRLEFPDESFGNLLCVEAAFHFHTRRDFLVEALRVLQPGGTLALSDLLMHLEAEKTRVCRTPDNYLPNLEAYEDLLRSVGFSNVRVEDATEACWRSYFRFAVRHGHEKFLRRELDQATLVRHLDKHYGYVNDIEYYPLVWAQK